MLRRLAVALMLVAAVRPVHAQNEALRPTVSDTLRARVLARAVSEAVSVNAEPRSFQVVRIPIPEVVRGREGLRYDIEVEPQFNVIGLRGGPLAGRASLTDLLVTLGVPADARAGKRTAARAVFRTPENEVEVPIELRVTSVHRIALLTQNQINDLRLGERFDLSATLRNDGNAADTIHVRYELPAAWATNLRDTVMVLLPHETAIRIVRITIPKNSGTGSFFVRTHASTSGASVSALTTLGVGTMSADAPPPGPMLRTSIGTVAVQNGESQAVAQFALSGPITSSVNIDARASSRPALGSAGIRGLSRVGSYVTTPHLAAWSSTWRANAGSTVANFSDITGVNAGGSGLSFDFNDQKSTFEFTAAQPVASSANGGGSILGVGVGRKLAFGTLSASASRLRAHGLFEQSLSSLGLELTSPRMRALQLAGGVSYRDYVGASGLGVTAGISRETDDMNAELRVVHAPGGSNAFARAQDEVVGSIVQSITKQFNVGASFYDSHDSNAAARNVRSRSVGITPQYRFTDQVSVRADVRSTSYEVDGNPFSFGNTERHLGGGASARWRDILYSTDLSFERITRTVDADNIDGSTSGDRFTWHGSAARAYNFGTFSLEGGYENSAAGTGYMPEQLLVAVRADRAQLPVGPRNLFLDAELGYSRWRGIRSVSTFRLGATYVLPYELEVVAAVERNPLFFAATANTPWVFALRLDKSVGLPRVMTGKAAGIVFQDYNGNGRRDADEPGMPNVIVRRGGARATTTHDGAYRFWDQARGRTSVDAASLPFGWMVNDKSAGEDIALVPTTRVEVVLQPGMAERLRNLDLTPAAVMARDSLGRVFVARRTGPTTALFDALPVGSYEIQLDFAAFSEPLRIDGVPPRIVITRETSTRVTVPVSGRPLRFRGQ